MITEVKDFKRKELFEHYNSFDNPFAIITTKIDVTNVVNYTKKNKNFYATLGYIVTKTINMNDGFKYRYKDGNFYYCDLIDSNYTQMYNNGLIGYFKVPYVDDFNEYKKCYVETEKKFLEEEKYNSENTLNEVWLSCEPWFSFTSLIPPFSKDITIPQVIWGKYELENDKYYVNIMTIIHHGFADGYDIGKFINDLQDNINKFNK